MSNNSRAILYIATSLDGYIAGENDDLSFLSIVEKPGEDYGYLNFMKKVDTIVMGNKTYNWIIKNAPNFFHSDKLTYVITHQKNENKGNIKFYSGDLSRLINNIKNYSQNDIFIEGGADIINQLLINQMIDEYYISIIPYILGSGTKLFKGNEPPQELSLIDSIMYDSGLVQLHYTNK